MNQRPYISDFVESVAFGRQLEGIEFNHTELSARIYQSSSTVSHRLPEIKQGLQLFAEQYIKSLEMRAPIEHSCHATSHGFAETFNSLPFADEVPLAITIGNIYYKGKNIYGVTHRKIEHILTKGFEPEKTIDVHVWLTLVDMTVLDLTVLSTLHALGLSEVAPTRGNSVLVWNQGSHPEIEFEPLLVDNDFFSKVDSGLVISGNRGKPLKQIS